MRERDGLGAELRDLDVRRERELPDVEHEGKAGDKPRKIILVAGVEYPRYDKNPVAVAGKAGKWWVLARGRTTPARSKDGSSHWRSKCLALAEHKLRADPGVEVFLYDFDRAIEERITRGRRGLEASPVRDKFPKLVDADYRWVDGTVLKPIPKDPLPLKTYATRPYIRYCPSVGKISAGDVAHDDWLKKFGTSNWQDHGMSIRDVYYHVEFIGQHKPYTLHELHLFGHASSAHYPHSGTAFVNTDHFGGDDKRHPLDIDARGDLDFIPATVDPRRFRMAFARGAMSVVWGCNWHRPVFDMIRQAHKATGGKPFTDTTVFRFQWREANVSGTKSDFQALMEADKGGWDDKKNAIEKTGAFVRRTLQKLLDDSYMQRLADASARCVTGGLPGTYSDYDEKGALRLSHIPMAGLFGPKEDFRPIMEFFATNFGTAFNRDGLHPKFGRGFALYCPK
ncbi:MAG TPA: hypothetical protein VFX28_21110 [Methylomirabilota bacterium]|nr:hypothetical protein [Methylomirabilota bacterium]